MKSSFLLLVVASLMLVALANAFFFEQFQARSENKFDTLQNVDASDLERDPIVVIPGTPGSYFEAKINLKHPPFPLCTRKQNEWKKIFPVAEMFLPPFEQCITYDLSLDYDKENNLMSNKTGVDIRAIDYGGFNGTYFQDLEAFLTSHGYVVGQDLLCAPFDWRLDGHSAAATGYYDQLQTMIEQTYAANQNTKVHLLGHSGGSVFTHYFLTRYVDQAWKDKHINTFISMGGPWLGTPIATVFLLNPVAFLGNSERGNITQLGQAARTFGLLPMMMPLEDYYGSDVIIQNDARSYTPQDSLQVLKDGGCNQAYDVYENNYKEYNNVTAPAVTMHCLYSTLSDTPNSYVFSGNDFSNYQSTNFGDGDSVVPVASGQYCQNWASEQTQEVYAVNIPGVNHGYMPSSSEFLNYILNVTTHRK